LAWGGVLPTLRAASPAAPSRLARALAPLHNQYDPEAQMLRRPFHSPGYHTALTGGQVHPTRESLGYALGLLDAGGEDHLRRAEGIIRRVAGLQDENPASPTHGVWSWFLEEPLDRMRPPDYNWADFLGALLAQIVIDHGSRLDPEVRAVAEAAWRRACLAIRRRNVGPGYTNIAIMGAFVTLAAGERLDWPEMADYGRQRVARFHAFTQETGWFLEYNSPTYTVVAIEELARLAHYARDAGCRAQAQALLRIGWREMAEHFHPPTRQWAGPHSRAYRTLLSADTLAFVQHATGGRVDFGVDRPSLLEGRLPMACPPDLEPFFQTLEAPRWLERRYTRGASPLIGRTWVAPAFTLGSVNRGEMWTQRRNVLAYWGKAEAPSSLTVHFLRDGHDLATATFRGEQQGGRLLGGITLATDGGLTHLSLDRLREGRLNARDLRLRFAFGGAAAGADFPAPPAAEAEWQGEPAGLPIRLRLFASAWPEASPGWEWVRERNLAALDWVIYRGAARDFDLRTLPRAAWLFGLALGGDAAQPAAAAVEADGPRLSARWHDLQLAVPVRPARQRDLLADPGTG
jgi:hypothetical protein